MSTPGPGLPEALELDTAAGRDRTVRVGPSMHGWVYRSAERPFRYRVLPLAASPLALRAEAREWKERARRPGIAPIAEAEQDAGKGVFFIRYEAAAGRSLDELWGEPDASLRLGIAAAVAESLESWWETLGPGRVPMPAEVVLGPDGEPQLLAAPVSGIPAIGDLLGEPLRVLHLAPEAVRGVWGGDGEDLDRYAIGVALLRLLCTIEGPEAGPEGLLRVANGTALDAMRIRSSLPFWLERGRRGEAIRGEVRQLVARDPQGRRRCDPAGVGRRLRLWSEQVEPVRLVESVREAEGPEEALALAHDILLERETEELLLLAGRCAGQAFRPLEAVELFEGAIARNPSREAIEEQLQAIASLVGSGTLGHLLLALSGESHTREKLDALLWRDFHRLPPARQEAFELAVARYLLGREDWEAVSRFIYPRIYPDEKKYLWWKFDLTLGYAEALISSGRLDAASELLADIQKKLVRVRENNTLPSEKIQRHGARFSELEAALHHARRGGGSAASAGSSGDPGEVIH